MIRPPVILATISLGVLSACVEPGGDACAAANRDVNLFSLMSNTVTGSYDRCLGDLRGELAAAQLRSRTLRAEAASLRAEQNRLSGEQAAAAARLARLNEQQATTLAQLASAENAQSVEQARLAQVLAEERQISQRIEQLNAQGGGASAAEAEQLQAQQAWLRAQLNALGL